MQMMQYRRWKRWCLWCRLMQMPITIWPSLTCKWPTTWSLSLNIGSESLDLHRVLTEASHRACLILMR